MAEIQDCVRERETAFEGQFHLVQDWRQRLRGLVCMPMDRNPGATYVVCPTVYARALRDMFWHGGSFIMCTLSADEALATCRRKYEVRGLKDLGAWRKKGRFGDVYVLPKHKDPARWRPIAPAWNSPSKVGAKKVAKALQCMLGNLARGLHFNTYLSEDAIKRLHGWASHLEKGHGVMTASFDIKNMFAELPHAAILESLEWMIRMMEAKGFDRVNVNCRGKKPAMGRQNRNGHFPVKFDCIRKWVRYELEFSYSLAEGELIQQIQGIPMGGHTSPSLACILCVHGEAQFMYELGTLRKRILGLRLMDDVAVFVRFISDDELAFLSEGGDPHDENLVRGFWHDDLQLLLVTRGAGGSSYFTKSASGHVPGVQVSTIDTTGAGDAFVAGLLSQIVEDRSILTDEEKLRSALHFANACGAITTTERGAIPALPDRETVLRMMSKTMVA
ncbi:hypothetical protein CBR_g39648 [Chara braunii]|uniref:Carbohydrate kinase PfkB domain-containing protein n=1 Tax=Chara braunii TaxID=69332 RepID=A0A388K1F9_CHABU|nr:hypothetical protein CBR_g39648 [Chara braunii]|eukprot:GBG63867.1 hypothetical protein CBR_g39648 [Chara braunii]